MIATIYLILSVLLFTTTIGAVNPQVYGLQLGAAGAVPFLVVALFMPQVILLGLLITALTWGLDGLDGTLGRIGLALHVVSWLMLCRYLLLLRKTLPILDGQPVDDDADPFPDLPTPRQTGRPAQISFQPLMTFQIAARRDVEVVRDIIYREVDGVRLRLDVYRPRERTSGTCPSAIYIHGGAWFTGTRRQSRFLCYELAAAGWAVFAISYRRAPRFPLPAAICDCKAAVAWVREHAREYGARPEAVAIGGSAGGHLAAMVALTPDVPEFQPGFESADTRVLGAVPMYPMVDFVQLFERNFIGGILLMEHVVFRARYSRNPELFRKAQPMSYVSDRAPPLLIVHGRNDSLIPFAESRRLYQSLREAGSQRVHLLEMPRAQHAFDITPSPLHQRAVRIILRFMESLQQTSTPAV